MTPALVVPVLGRSLYPGASVALDFTRNLYRSGTPVVKGSPSLLSGWTFTRASTGHAETAAGALVNFASGSPRITDKGLLVEEARTNLLLRSQEFDHASWSKTDITITPNDALAPDGTLTADLVTQGSAGTAAIAQAVTATADVVHTATRFFKYNGSRWVLLRFRSGGNVVCGWFDLLNGVVGTAAGAGTGTSVTSSISALADGWYRCRVSGNVASGATALTVEDFAASADASTSRLSGGTYHEWGAQFENNTTFPTSYIPTTTASATRAADVATITGLSTLLASDFTLIIDAAISSGSSGATSFVGDTGSAERFGTFRSGGTTPTAQSRTGGASTNATFAVSSGDVVIKSAHASFAASSRASITGAAVQALAANRPTGMHTLIVGALATSSTWLNGYVRKLIIYPRAFSDAELQAASL